MALNEARNRPSTSCGADCNCGVRTAWRASQAVVVAAPEGVADALRTLRDDPELAFDLLADLTAVDYLGRSPRFASWREGFRAWVSG